MLTICFTGHRPNKLKGGYDLESEDNYNLGVKILENALKIINKSKEQHFKFIFGGALGVDQLSFIWIYHLQEHQAQLKQANYLDNRPMRIDTIIAIPFDKQFIKWKEKDVDRWRDQFFKADEVIFVDTLDKYKFDKVPIGEYHPAKMQLRNQYMVDNSDIVIAVWDGSSGGTGNCVKYAKKKDKDIIVINPKDI